MMQPFQGIDNCFMLQHNEFEMALNDERKKVLQRCQSFIYAKLVTKISKYALLKTHEAYISFKSDESQQCTGRFSRVFGLPCPDKIKQYENKMIN
jgi:hypothetical protein